MDMKILKKMNKEQVTMMQTIRIYNQDTGMESS